MVATKYFPSIIKSCVNFGGKRSLRLQDLSSGGMILIDFLDQSLWFEIFVNRFNITNIRSSIHFYHIIK